VQLIESQTSGTGNDQVQSNNQSAGMRTRFSGLVFLLVAGLQARSVSEDVSLTAQTKNGQSSFHVGELISLELSYSLAPTSSNSYQITNASYSRSGRLGIESFLVEPATGWDDPLKLYFQSFSVFMRGGPSSFSVLSAKPIVIPRDLNERVRFNHPGRYRVVVTSSRVGPIGTTFDIPNPELRSNELWLTIVPATPEWQETTLARAVAALSKRESGAAVRVPDPAFREGAAQLRYLGTPAAAIEMAARLNDERTAFNFMLGLASTPARDTALERMKELLNDPAFPVNGIFLEAMSLVALPPQEISNRPEELEKLEQRFRQDLLKALPSKRGEALAVSTYSIVEDAAVYSRHLPAEQKRSLTIALVANFDRLPARNQLELLQSRWGVLDHQAIRPLLPRIAQYAEAESNELSGAALTRWWETDPESARVAILEEIGRPSPRFGAAVLGVLPDQTLPQLDQPLANHLTDGSGGETIASLISRYATASVEPQMTGYLDGRIGKLACGIQDPLLAYILRVDPPAAIQRLDLAMAARGPGLSRCNHNLLVGVAELHNDPALENLAIKSLNDSDPQVVGNAAAYLASYGSAAAEAPLWDCLTAWSHHWKGREAELRYVPGRSLDGAWQAGAGSNIIAALAGGQGWLTDDKKLGRLLELSVGSEQRDQIEQLRQVWRERPRRMQFVPFRNGQFQIAQYHSLSVKFAIDKLNQFPKGSSFVWEGDLKQDGESKAFEDLSNVANARGITMQRSLP
jgi:hypothetical protein